MWRLLILCTVRAGRHVLALATTCTGLSQIGRLFWAVSPFLFNLGWMAIQTPMSWCTRLPTRYWVRQRLVILARIFRHQIRNGPAWTPSEYSVTHAICSATTVANLFRLMRP